MSMRRYFGLGISLVLFAQACTLHAAESWRRLESPAASHVAAVWQSPPPEYGPEPYYGLNGPVTIEQVERDLDTMKRLGFQAVTVQAGYNMPFAYLSPEYFAFFRKFVEEAKRRNMRVWIVDDAGYPSGFAGGRFSSMAPNLRMQALEVVQQIPVGRRQRVAPGAGTGCGERCGSRRRGTCDVSSASWRRARLDRASGTVDGADRRPRVSDVSDAFRHESEASEGHNAIARRLSEPGGDDAVSCVDA